MSYTWAADWRGEDEPAAGHRLGCNLHKPSAAACNCDDDRVLTLAERLDRLYPVDDDYLDAS